MKFVSNEDVLNVEIRINLKDWGNLRAFSSGSQISDEMADRFKIEPQSVHMVPLNLPKAKKELFQNTFFQMLISNSKPDKFEKIDVTRQMEELTFIAEYLSELKVEQLGLKDKSNDFEEFTKIMEVLNAKNKLNQVDLLKITFIQHSSEVNPSVELPKAKNTLELYEYICNAIYRYYADNATTFGLKWYLFNAYKEPRTLKLMNEKMQQISQWPIPDEDTMTGLYILYLLPYIRLLPQFRSNHKSRNIVITGPQAIFIDRYFVLFGLYKHRLKVDTSKYEQFKSPRQLRALFSRFLKNYNLTFE